MRGLGEREPRVAGLDDHTALCAKCGGLMLRLDEDVFAPYCIEQPPAAVFLDYSKATPPAGCDGLCRFDCKVYDPKDAYCQEQAD